MDSVKYITLGPLIYFKKLSSTLLLCYQHQNKFDVKLSAYVGLA